MQIFSAYKKVERGGVRTLAFLHSFACFFIYLFFTSDILQFAQQICLFVLIFIVLNWENIVTSCTVQLCQLASCYEWKCSSSSIYHFFWHTWNTIFFLIGLCPGLLKQREGHQRHLTLCGDATVSLSFSELTCWSPIPTLSFPRYQRKGWVMRRWWERTNQ